MLLAEITSQSCNIPLRTLCHLRWQCRRVEPECQTFDTEPDSDVNFHDLGAFQRFFTGGN